MVLLNMNSCYIGVGYRHSIGDVKLFFITARCPSLASFLACSSAYLFCSGPFRQNLKFGGFAFFRLLWSTQTVQFISLLDPMDAGASARDAEALPSRPSRKF
jgi:hypothetical protein